MFLDFLILFSAISIAFASAVNMEAVEGILWFCTDISRLKGTEADDTDTSSLEPY